MKDSQEERKTLLQNGLMASEKTITPQKYRVTVEFGTERLEDCIIRLLKEKEKNMRWNSSDKGEET